MSAAPLLAYLEEHLPCLFDEMGAGIRSTYLAGSITHVRIDEAADLVEVSTPVDGAHNGLAPEVLVDLLKLNFPNELIGQSHFAQGAASGYLDLRDSFPVTSMTGEQALARILEQIVASLEVADRIVQVRHKAMKSIGRV